MAAVETRVCETDGCSSEAKLQCPTCIKLGIQGSYFCSQVDTRPPEAPPPPPTPSPPRLSSRPVGTRSSSSPGGRAGRASFPPRLQCRCPFSPLRNPRPFGPRLRRAHAGGRGRGRPRPRGLGAEADLPWVPGSLRALCFGARCAGSARQMGTPREGGSPSRVSHHSPSSWQGSDLGRGGLRGG